MKGSQWWFPWFLDLLKMISVTFIMTLINGKATIFGRPESWNPSIATGWGGSNI